MVNKNYRYQQLNLRYKKNITFLKTTRSTWTLSLCLELSFPTSEILTKLSKQNSGKEITSSLVQYRSHLQLHQGS
jgi:hypothetical protein